MIVIDGIPMNQRLYQLIVEEAEKKNRNLENFISDLILEGYIKYIKEIKDAEKKGN